jgi:hypothetical protein
MTQSETAQAINANGTLAPPGAMCDRVTIGFGTGRVTGEFVRERVCLGSRSASNGTADGPWLFDEPCVDMRVVNAVEMSSQPFKSFAFDGILGLGLSGLALYEEFSFFGLFAAEAGRRAPQHRGGLGAGAVAQFAAFLTEGEDGETSEMAFGGHDPTRALDPLSWAPVALPELGYWQVEIRAVRVGGVTLDICRDGTCRGVVDTGTSHLGVPAPYDVDLAALLTLEVGSSVTDCRGGDLDVPALELEIPGRNLTLGAENYMRRMPLAEGISVSSGMGVTMTVANASLAQGSSRSTTSADSARGGGGSLRATAAHKQQATGAAPDAAVSDAQRKRYCQPRIMPVTLPAPLGPKLFILGEPMLHRYYTVFDWERRRIGLGLAANRRNRAALAAAKAASVEDTSNFMVL